MCAQKKLLEWHSKESRKIELLRWREKEEDFAVLCAHAIGTISRELHERGLNMRDLAEEEELRQAVRLAAENYTNRHAKLIGLEIHVTLFLRSYIAMKMRDATS
jgi:hypothetical protein